MLHISNDISYCNLHVINKVYEQFTTVYRCDQGIIDSLSIANLLLGKLHKDLSRVKDLYVKSDNDHGNSYAEALYVMCKDNGFIHKRYGYNEPCHGKDHYDHEAAGAKSLMRSYIDAGNDILTAEGVFKPGIMVKVFKMRKLLVFPSTLANKHYHHVPQFQRSVNTTHLSFIMTT